MNVLCEADRGITCPDGEGVGKSTRRVCLHTADKGIDTRRVNQVVCVYFLSIVAVCWIHTEHGIRRGTS